MPQDDKALLETDRGNNKQIRRGNLVGICAEAKPSK
jgi:hypothetical protein